MLKQGIQGRKGSYKVNEEILAEYGEVTLVDHESKSLGKISTREALRQAKASGLDLVLVAVGGQGAVCRITDYSKVLYNLRKRKPPKKQEISCVQFSIKIDVSDYKIKLKKILSILEKGDKVTAVLRCKGREISHINTMGLQVLNRVVSDLESQAKVEFKPKIEGRLIKAGFAPLSKKSQSASTEAKTIPEAKDIPEEPLLDR